MSFFYSPWILEAPFRAGFDMREAGLDVRVAMVMSLSTAPTQPDAALLTDLTTLDEYDGSGYSRVALTQTTAQSGSTAALFGASSWSWLALGSGTRPAVGLVVYEHGGGRLICFRDDGGFPFDGEGKDHFWAPSRDGFIRAEAA